MPMRVSLGKALEKGMPMRALLLGAVLAAGCGSVCPEIPMEEKKTFLSVRPEEGGYVINPQDSLSIEVWQNQQLTRQVTVRPDGKITLPLVNDVETAGNTVPQFQKLLTERLKTYIKDPIVSITVTQFSSKQIYMLGQVRTAGAFGYSGEMYLLQALTLAGGSSPFADGCAVVVRRKGEQFVRYNVELDPIMMGDDLKENLQLQPNDVVTVH
jgi:polysaccharide export outer membrane protein